MRLLISIWASLCLMITLEISAHPEFRIPTAHENMFGEAMMSCAFEGTYGPTIVPGATFFKPTLFESNGNYAFIFYQSTSGPTFYRSSASLDNAGNATYSSNVSSVIRPIEGQDFDYAVTQSGNSITLTKRNYPDGNTLWTKTYPIQVGEYWNRLSATRVGSRIVISALVLNPSPVHFFLIADSNGNELNQSTSTEEATALPSMSGVVSTPDGGYIMKFREGSNSGLLKINANATVAYKLSKVGDLVSNRDFYEGVAFNNSGYYVGVSGRSNNYAEVSKYNLNNGSLLWRIRLKDQVFPNSNPPINFQRLLGIERTPDGGVIVGYGYSNAGFDDGGTWILKLGSNGNVVWKRELDLDLNAAENPFTVEYGTEDGGFFWTKFNDDSIDVQRYNSDGLRLPECGGGGGCNVAITSSNGGVTITGLTSDANSKLFDSNTQAVWSCNPWQGNVCTNNETVSGLVTGATYFLSVQSASCNEWIPITIQGGGNTPTCSDGIQNQGETGVDCGGPCAPCNGGGCNVGITSSNGGVTITGLVSNANAKLFTSSVQAVWGCNPWQGSPCSGNESVSGLTVGATYFLSVQSSACDEWIPIVIQGGGGCIDNDNDGTCNEDDCQPNNPNLPAAPGTPCNDFNSGTTNDQIIEDGCTCLGNPIFGGCNINVVAYGGGDIGISGLANNANAKLFNSNTQVVWSCNPWQGTFCPTFKFIEGLTIGATYFLSVQSEFCDEWIPIVIQGGDCGCSTANLPVCGNGISFVNECVAECVGVFNYTQGLCDDDNTGGNGPDLLTQSLNIGAGAPGEILGFTFDLVNQGNTTASGSYSIKSYISNDGTLSGDDIQEGTINTGNTPVGSTSVNGAITVPNLPAGTYFFFLVVDDGNNISETDENNNVRVGSLVITSGGNGCNPTNVAQGKSATQSSNLNFGGINSGASNAVDGNTDGNYYNGSVAVTNDENQAWWQVDLGALYELSSIQVYNRTEGTARLNDFYILTSSNPYTSGNLGNARSNSNNERYVSGQAGTPTTWNFSGAPVRYVRIQRTGNGYATIAEVKVNGCLVSLPENNIHSFEAPSKDETATLLVSDLFPNPTTGEVFSKIESSTKKEISIQVVNILGQVNLQQKMQLEAGQNNLQLDLDKLENGIYNVIIYDGIHYISKQLVIAK